MAISYQECSWAQRNAHGVCTPHFDFSLRFEQLILSILPSTIFLLATFWRILALSKTRNKTQRTLSRLLKLTTAISYTAAQFVVLILWSRDPQHTGLSVAASALSLVLSLGIAALAVLEHDRTIRPSSLIIAYLLLSCLFDAAQLRTLLLLGSGTGLSVALSLVIGSKLCLLALEARSKAQVLKDPYKKASRESVSSVISRSLYWWTIPLLAAGYRRLLSSADILSVDESIRSAGLAERLNNGIARSDMSKPRALLLVCLRCFKWDIAAMIPTRLALICFTYSQTFLLDRAVSFLSQPASSESKNITYGLVGATFFIYLGIAVSTALYERRVGRVMIKLRGAIVASVFSRGLIAADGADTEHAAITLMSTDVDTIIRVFAELNEAWARLIEVLVGIALLSRQVGAISVVPILLALASTQAQTWVSKRIGDRRKLWNAATQKRVGATASTLGSVQPVRISGLMMFAAEHLQSLRIIELRVAAGFLKFVVGLNAIAVIPSIWAPVLTWIIYAIKVQVGHEAGIDTAQAFTSLALLFLITTPTAKLLTIMPRWAQASACFERLQQYFTSETYHDRRNATFGLKQPNTSIVETNDAGDIALATFPSRSDGPAVSVQHIRISAPKSTNPLISDASFEAATGTLTVIIGPPGSGKTTLLKALLGEVDCASGHIALATKSIAYCAQSPWITDTTIAKFIKGPAEATDESWYQQVIRDCQLDHDLQNQPEGDDSKIGSRGISLSGGQRARLALARAAYAGKDVLLLDDVLSAVDSRTEAAIVASLASNDSAFRRGDRTIIAVSHSSRLIDIADTILRLSDGKLTKLDRSLGHSLSSSYENAQNTQPKSEIGHTRKAAHPATKPPSEEQKQDMARQTGDWSIYKYYFRTTSWTSLLLFVACSVGMAFCSSFTQVWLQWWTQSGTSSLSLYLTVFAALACFSMLLTSANMVMVFLKIMPSSSAMLHKVLLDTVTRAPYSLFYQVDTGTILNRFSQDMSHVCNALPTSLISTGNTLCETIASLILISVGASYMGISIPLVLIAMFFIQKVYLRTSRQLRYLDLERRSPLYSHFLETLEGVVTIRSLGWSGQAEEKNRELLDSALAPAYLLYCVQRWLRLVLDMTTMALAVVVVALALSMRETTSAGRLALALTNILSFSQSLSRLITEWTTMETSIGSIARIRSFASDPDYQVQHRRSHQDLDRLDGRWPSQGSVAFNRVYAKYETKDARDHHCLEDISLTLQAGQKVSICGRTGSGKTSLMLALFQVLPLSSGSIVIDGIDVSTLSPDQLQGRLIGVPQQAFIMPDSVRRNLDHSGTLRDEDLVAVLAKVALQDVIEQLGGLDATLNQSSLSQGQQQLFCLARALCRRKNGGAVVVLDEPTSNLDSATHDLAAGLIASEMRDCTVITIAHRLDTILASDTVIFMDEARIAGFGPPRHLLQDNAGFKKLCQM